MLFKKGEGQLDIFMLLQNKKVYLSFSITIIFVMVFLVFGGLISQPVVAAPTTPASPEEPSATQYGLTPTAKKAGFEAKETTSSDLATFIGQLIGAVLAFVGVLFLGLMIYGGGMWMIARGNEQAVTKAKDIIVNSIIGIVIIGLSYAATSFIISQLGAGEVEKTSSQTSSISPWI